MNIKDVYKIKASGNPDKIISDGVMIKDLSQKSYQDRVEIFNKRIQSWFFDTIKSIESNTASNFMLTATACILIDLFSQYLYGVEHSSKTTYIRFFKEYLNDINHNIDPPIKTCKYNPSKKEWVKDEISTIAEGFYSCFRCGVLHSARIMEYGRINRKFSEEIIKVIKWDQNENINEINVNAFELLVRLETIFKKYIEDLKKEKIKEQKIKEQKINFLKRFNFEYGIIEKHNGEDLIINL